MFIPDQPSKQGEASKRPSSDYKYFAYTQMKEHRHFCSKVVVNKNGAERSV